MTAIIHIGPSKTASTSIQEIIPQLGIPYSIKPSWGKLLCRHPSPSLSPFIVPDSVLVSDEVFGDFDHYPAAEIAQRLEKLFGRAIVIYIHRDLEERIRSLHAQFLSNNALTPTQISYDEFRARLKRAGETLKLGPFGNADLGKLANDFGQHDFHSIDFAMLKSDPSAFLKAFCDICGVPVPASAMPHLNRTER